MNIRENGTGTVRMSGGFVRRTGHFENEMTRVGKRWHCAVTNSSEEQTVSQKAIGNFSQFLSIASFFFMGSHGPVLAGESGTLQLVISDRSVAISLFEHRNRKYADLSLFIEGYFGRAMEIRGFYSLLALTSWTSGSFEMSDKDMCFLSVAADWLLQVLFLIYSST
jgi:hypothetical protein